MIEQVLAPLIGERAERHPGPRGPGLDSAPESGGGSSAVI